MEEYYMKFSLMSQDMNILDSTEAKHKPTHQVFEKDSKTAHGPDNIKLNLCFASESK